MPADVQVDFSGKQEESDDESPTSGADSKYSASVPRRHLSSSRSTIISGLPVCLKIEAARTSPSTASLRGAGVFSGRVGRALFVKRAQLLSGDGGSYASTPCVATPHKDQAATIVLQRSSSACSSLSPVHRAASIHVLSGTPQRRMCLVFDDTSGAQVLKWSYDLKSAATFRVVHLGVSSARRRSAGALHCAHGPIVLGAGSPRSRRLKADSGFYLESTAFRGLYISLRDPRSSDSSPCGAPRLVLRASPATLVAMTRAPSVPPTTPRSTGSATKLDHVRDAASAMWGLEQPDLPTKHSIMVGLVEFLRYVFVRCEWHALHGICFDIQMPLTARSAPSTVNQLMHNFVGVSWAQSLRCVCSDLAALVRTQVVGFRMQPTFELIPLPHRVCVLGNLFSAATCLQRLVLRDMPDLAAVRSASTPDELLISPIRCADSATCALSATAESSRSSVLGYVKPAASLLR